MKPVDRVQEAPAPDIQLFEIEELMCARACVVAENVLAKEIKWGAVVERITDTLSFEGDRARAEELLSSFGQGAQEVVKTIPERFMPSKVALVVYEATEGYNFFWDDKLSNGALGPAIYIRKDNLEDLSTSSNSEPHVFYDFKNKPYLTCYPDEYFYLAGAEEAHHSFTVGHLGIVTNDLVRNLSVDVYNAQDHEWEALIFKLALAKKRGLSSEAVTSLEKHYQGAREVRGLLGRESLNLIFQDMIERI